MRKMLWLFPITMVLVGCNICKTPMTWPGVAFWAILLIATLIAVGKAGQHSSDKDPDDTGGDRPAESPTST
jgi:hypothetical protein